MNKFKINPGNIFLIAALITLVLFSVYFFLLRNNIAPDNSSAANTGKLVLQLASPATLVDQPVNTNFSVNLSAQNVESDKVAEVVLNYDPTYLEGVLISEASNLLALNKNINNTTGVITVDVAITGESSFTAGNTLVTFNFKIKNNSAQSTTLSIAQGSTLGYPNRLASNGYGNLVLNFKNVVTNVCGDGVSGGSEQCDAGANNGKLCQPGYNSSCNYCSASCTTITLQGNKCGDGVIGGIEQCDNATNNGVACQANYGSTCNYCSATCTSQTVQGAKCGDGIKNGSEQCDDGNQNNTDSCSIQCLNTGIGSSGSVSDPNETTQPNNNTGTNANNTNTNSNNTASNNTSNTGSIATNSNNNESVDTSSNETETTSTTGQTTQPTGQNSNTGSTTTTSETQTNNNTSVNNTGNNQTSDPLVGFFAGLFPAQGTSNTILIALLIATILGVILAIAYIIRLVFFYRPKNTTNPFSS